MRDRSPPNSVGWLLFRGWLMKTKNAGFTLVEMMIVVMIIALLAAIAYPNYTAYAMRSRRADGKDLAMRIASAEERYFTNLNRYTSTLSDLGFASNLSEKQYYAATVVLGAAGQTYTITLTPQAGTPQVNDLCGSLTINNTGYKSQTGSETRCW